MSSPPPLSPLVPDDVLDELAEKGQSLYDSLLKAVLEPERSGDFVVIHVDTGEYAVARTFTEANRAMRLRCPGNGRLFGRKIGPDPDDDSVAARILLSEMRASSRKCSWAMSGTTCRA